MHRSRFNSAVVRAAELYFIFLKQSGTTQLTAAMMVMMYMMMRQPGGVCWPEASLSVWLAAVLSSAWVWFFYAVEGTVSRKLSSSPFYSKV